MAKSEQNSIKQSTTNNIGYKGDVSISFVRDKSVKKTIRTHNEGTDLLFKNIAYALTNADMRNSFPRYMDVFSGGKSILSYRCTLTAKTPVAMDGGGYAVSFTAFVPSSDINSTERTFDELRVYNQSTAESSLLARLSLSPAEQIPTDYAIAVEWKMWIGNKNTEGSGT